MDSIWKLAQKKEMRYTLLTLLASAVNYVTMILYSHVLDVETYARVNTSQSFLANYTVFIMPVGIILCREIAEHRREEWHIQSLKHLAVVITTLTCIFPLLFYRQVMHYLDQKSPMELTALIAAVATYCVYFMFRSATQGRQLFVSLGIAELLLYGIKLPLSFLLISGGAGVAGPLTGIAVAQMISAFFMIDRIKSAKGVVEADLFESGANSSVLSGYWHVLLVQITISVLINNGEILVANFYCGEREIGLYMVAAHLSKILFYVISVMGTILLPKVAANKDHDEMRIRYLRLTLSCAAVFAGTYAAIVFGCRKLLIHFLYSDVYADAEYYFIPALVYAICLSMFFLYNQYLMATDRQNKPAMIMLVSMTVFVIILLFTKPSMYQISWYFSALIIFMFLCILTSIGIENRGVKRHAV